MIGTISGIKKPFGMQPKKDGSLFGPAQLVEVELENGEIATIFVWTEKAIGEKLEVEKNGQYWNEVKAKKSSLELEPIMNLLTALKAQNEEILNGISELLGNDRVLVPTKAQVSGYEQAKATATAIHNKEPLPEYPGDEYVGEQGLPY